MGDKSTDFFSKDASKFILNAFLSPFIWWRIIFESHKDVKLHTEAQKTRKYFFIFLTVFFGNFILHFLALYLHWLSY
jgi:hypothetical protein